MRRPAALLLVGTLSVALAGLVAAVDPASGRATARAAGPVELARNVEQVQEKPSQPLEPDERLAAPRAPSAWRCGTRPAPEAVGEPPGSPRFSLQFLDEVSALPLVPAFVMPGQTFEIEAVLTARGSTFSAIAESGLLERKGPERWIWTAPERAGSTDVEVRESSGSAICLRAFVMVAYDGSEIFREYRIGRYEPKPYRGDPAYHVPRGLVEVTAANRDTWLTPHFQLHQFECKQSGPDPHFLVLTTRLLAKLEALLEAFRHAEIEATTLFVMSGYRTPAYNRDIGNQTPYSRHAYGDAADIFIDEDRNGRMDDLDGDGDGDAADARRLYDIANELADEDAYRPFLGGLALYGPAPHRGPFIHVDTRGKRARW
jgi:hypothetical protein